MRSKLAARVLAAALLAATLNVPAQAAPAAGHSWLQASSWWDWLGRLPQRVLLGWEGKRGMGADPNGLQNKQGWGVDPNGLTNPAPTTNAGGGSSDAGSGVNPNG